jgi:hypothetical protein
MELNEAREIAAQCWCDPETQHLVMNTDLAEAFAKRLVEAWNRRASQASEPVAWRWWVPIPGGTWSEHYSDTKPTPVGKKDITPLFDHSAPCARCEDSDKVLSDNMAFMDQKVAALEAELKLYRAEMSEAREAGFESASDIYTSYVGVKERLAAAEKVIERIYYFQQDIARPPLKSVAELMRDMAHDYLAAHREGKEAS